jgi:hypothetical protein
MKSPKERLEEIRDAIECLNNEALDIVKTELTRFDVERSKAYWYGYIDNAITGDKQLCPCPMQEMIVKLGNYENEEEYSDYIGDGRILRLPKKI